MKKEDKNNVSAKQVNNVYNATSEANEVTSIVALEAESEASNEASEAEAVGTTGEVNAVVVGSIHTPRVGRFAGVALQCTDRKKVLNGNSGKYIEVFTFIRLDTSEVVTTTPSGHKTAFTSPEVKRQILGIEPKAYDRNGSRSILTLDNVPNMVKQVQAKQAKLKEASKQLNDLCKLYGIEAEASEESITEAVTAYITNKQLQAVAEAEAKRNALLEKQVNEANAKARKQSKIATMQRAIEAVNTAKVLGINDAATLVAMLVSQKLASDEAEAVIIVKHCNEAK